MISGGAAAHFDRGGSVAVVFMPAARVRILVDMAARREFEAA